MQPSVPHTPLRLATAPESTGTAPLVTVSTRSASPDQRRPAHPLTDGPVPGWEDPGYFFFTWSTPFAYIYPIVSITASWNCSLVRLRPCLSKWSIPACIVMWSPGSSCPTRALRPIPEAVSDTDARLAYVAVTRARSRLDLGGLSWIDNYPRPGQ